MCATCGCDANAATTYHSLVDHHHHDHQHHSHGHGHHHHHDQHLHVEQDVLHHNNMLAQRNRGYFEAKNIIAINLVSSPGSGKTTLLERTLHDMKGVKCYVIEGDQQTRQDADRIHATGTPVVQINTGKGCHLDAHMVFHAIEHLQPISDSVLFIENVGNLVCPAMFDLGETARVVIASVTEGDDKPLKYPDMFHSSQLCIINKVDLEPYVPFDIDTFISNAKKVNPDLEFLEVSALKADGLLDWYTWIRKRLRVKELV